MKSSFLLASLGLVGTLASGPALAAGATSTFDTDADGWTVSDFTVGGGTPASWLPAGMIQTFDAYSWTVFGVIARLALVAASYELEATDPHAEVYE